MPLSALYECWPDSVRQDITQSNWNGASVVLPMNRLDVAMKSGRVAFTWGELMQWLDVLTASISSLHRETSLELPLKVIAPLFMSQRKAPVDQKKVVIGENIPNLFEGLAKPSAPACSCSSAIPTAPPLLRRTCSRARAGCRACRPASVLGEIFGQPSKQEWSPQEITQGLNALPGVAASLIAMNDGLLVSGDLPAPLKSETMAAFLPQMFGRMSHYAGEIQLGPVTAMTLQAGQTQCAILQDRRPLSGRSGQARRNHCPTPS